MSEQPHLYFDVEYPGALSRLMIFVKWLLVIPHLLVLSALGFALSCTTIFAWFAILFTARYPRSLWSFAVMTLRWQANVSAYYSLQSDLYPPFGEGDYSVRLEIAYPERMSRLLIFVKWLLVIPHLFVLYFLGVLSSICVFIAWFAILFTARYPAGLFETVTIVSGWSYRVTAYLLLLTDAYPPFSMSGPPRPHLPISGQPPYSTLPGSQW